MSTEFSEKLKALMQQFEITNAQLSKALNVDPSLVSRWLTNGCSKRKLSQHALSVGNYFAGRRITPQNCAWLRAELGCADYEEITPQRIALWLAPNLDIPVNSELYANLMVVQSFREPVAGPSTDARQRSVYALCDGGDSIAAALKEELIKAVPGSTIDIFLSSEATACAVDGHVLDVLRELTESRQLHWRMLVQSSNNSAMSSRLVSAYMPLLVQGQMVLFVVQGTPQTFTASMSVMIPNRCALVMTEVVQKKSAAVAAVIRDAHILSDMCSNFEETMRFAGPMMTAYDNSFARNII